ncbi:MAG: outer membrane beta-barrel protein [Saprospiraceae bacterium]
MTLQKSDFIKFYFLLIIICFGAQLMAQDKTVSTETDTNTTKDEDFERRWKKNETRYHNWGIHFGDNWDNDWDDDFRVGLIDIGFSTYFHDGSLNLPAELDNFDQTYGGSLNLNLHLIRHRLPIIKDHLGLEYGLTVSWQQYKFANDFKILEDTIPFSIEDDGTTYKKNKLKTTFLEVPLMLTISPGKRKSFYISGGVYGGVLLGAKQKLKDDNGNKTKIKDDFNLNKFRYGVIGRIGFGPFALYGQLALTDLFKDNQGPQLTPFNVGISILDF